MTLHRIFHAIALAMLMAATFDSHAQVAKVNGAVIPQAHLDMVVQTFMLMRYARHEEGK